MTISGSARSAVFDMADSGNDSVVLPTSAISAAECFDEPGVASNIEGSAGVTIDSTTLTTILSRTITVPDAGYVLVLGASQVQIPHVTGTNDLYNFGVSDSSTVLPGNQDLFTTVVAALPSATYQKVVSPHGLFAVSAGSHTFYLVGEKTNSSSANAEAFDVQFTLAYFSTAYGTVVSTNFNAADGDGDRAVRSDRETAQVMRSGMSTEEIAAEQAQSVADNQARLERELAELRARFDALQIELEEIIRAQQAAAYEARSPKPAVPVIEEGQ